MAENGAELGVLLPALEEMTPTEAPAAVAAMAPPATAEPLIFPMRTDRFRLFLHMHLQLRLISLPHY